MDCNICLDQDDGDPVDLFHTTIVRAAKEHKCYECNAPIVKGERHELCKTLYEHQWYSNRTCLACVEIHRALSSCDREDGRAGFRMLGCLWADLEEYVFGEMTVACVAKCQTAAAKKKLTERWREWKFR
jgi:hypothetical protein